jgi:hypothetical protein
MARNYVEFWHSRVNQGGNFVSFVGSEQQEAIDLANAYIASFGGTADWLGKRGYFLLNKANVVALLQNWTTHYSAAFGSTWVFFQDGLTALESPRETWSHDN